jgi:hypothetical protein
MIPLEGVVARAAIYQWHTSYRATMYHWPHEIFHIKPTGRGIIHDESTWRMMIDDDYNDGIDY